MSGEIACACDGGTRLLKLSGEVRHDNAAALEELIEGWFDGEGEAINEVIIDLNALRFMDSTVIGLLAAIAREMAAEQRPKPVVFSTNAEINSLLRSLRLDEALTLVERCEQRPAALDADGPTPQAVEAEGSSQVSAASILRAHELLMDLSDENRAAFQPVVELLRAERGKA